MNMSKKLILSILILLSYLFSQFKNEELIYDVEIKKGIFPSIKVGKCNLKVDMTDEKHYKMKIITQTNSTSNFFYSYFDSIELLLDNDFSLLDIGHITISNKKKTEKYANIDKDTKSIFSNGKKLNFYNDNLFSPYSLIYFLRTQDFKTHETYNYKIFDGKKIKNILLKVLNIEKIKVPYGTFKCFHVTPNNKKIIQNNTVLEIWYTNDKDKKPIQIKLKSKIGTITMKLKKIIQK